VGVQEVRWEKGGTLRAGDYNFFYGNGNHQFGTEFFVYHKIVSAVTTVELVSKRQPYKILRGHWCNIIVLIV